MIGTRPQLSIEVADRVGCRRAKALDLGCAVGRSTFHLARSFEHVTGVDFSHRFVQFANDVRARGAAPAPLRARGRAAQLKAKGELPYKMRVEGDLFAGCVASLSALGIVGCVTPARSRVCAHGHRSEAKRCTFVQGDACNLDPTLTGKRRARTPRSRPG
jgi:SAM-dependent methyltransferase